MSIGKASDNFKGIDGIEETTDQLTARAGLAVVAKYLKDTGLCRYLVDLFPIKRRKKGTSTASLFHQILLFFMDGTASAISFFDKLAAESSYRQCIGITETQSVSSHAVKRFIQAFDRAKNRAFRQVLIRMFETLLETQKPQEIVLDIDSVVFDNDDALKREDCTPTYKKVKGFQPLLVKWGPFVVWADFRSGSTHCNHGNGVKYALVSLVKVIRKVLGDDIPIRVTLDAGFFDDDNFTFMEKVLHVSYVCSGKLYHDLASRLDTLPNDRFTPYVDTRDTAIWEHAELLDCRASWSTLRRVIYTRRIQTTKGQKELLGPDAVYYTNLEWEGQRIVDLAHSRGEAELVHRRIKDFADQILPFKRFSMNEAWFFLMLVAFNVFEMFKQAGDDVLETAAMYPTTFRRQIIDLAGKIVRHADKIILKVTSQAFATLSALWEIPAIILFPQRV